MANHFSKEEFLFEYIMNRAKTSPNLNGEQAVAEAIKAWKAIKRELSDVNR